MGICTVLGLGPSLSLYKPDGSLTIGVNDIWRFVHTDYVVCLDTKQVFSTERLKFIEECKPIKFYSIFPTLNQNINDWTDRPDFQRIELQPYYPDYECHLKPAQLPKSHCSPFVACAIAYKFHKATEIHVYGVDLLNHPVLKRETYEVQIKKHFHNLKVALRMKGCELIVHGDGILKKI